MFSSKIVLVLSGLCCISSAKITVGSFKENLFLQECIEEILDSYFNFSDVILYFNLDEGQNADFNVLPVIKVNNLAALKGFQLITPDWYIIMARNITQIVKVLMVLIKDRNWNPQAKFLIAPKGDATQLLLLLLVFEWLQILNFVILSEETNYINIATCFPYDDKRPNYPTIGKCTKGHLEQYENLFPRKVPERWDNITVTVLFGEYVPYAIPKENNIFTGIEVDLFKLVQTKIGFKVHPVSLMEISSCSEGTCSFDTGLEFRYKIRIYLGVTYQSRFYEEISIPLLYDTLQWAVPVANLEITWYRLANIFNYSIWIALGGVVVIIPFLFYFLAVQASDKVNYRRLSECLMMTVQCLIGQPVNVMPTRNSVRIFLSGMLMFSCVIIIAFQSRLLWDFYDDTKQISTTTELLASNLKIGFPEALNLFVEDKGNNIDNKVLKMKEECDIIFCINRTATEKNYATFGGKHAILYINNRSFLGKNKESQIYFLKDGMIEYPITLRFFKGFPLGEDINRVIEDLRTHGITQHLSDKLDYAAEKPILLALEMQYAPHVMNLKKLEGPFWLLLFGWCVSTVVFFCEVLYHKYVARRRRRIDTRTV